MKIKSTASLALNSLRTNKARAFLTTLGIIIGVAAVILLVSIGSGIKSYITEQFEELGTNLIMIMPGKFRFQDEGGREGGPPGISVNKLTLPLAQKIERKGEYVASVLPVVTKTVVAKYGNQSKSTGVIGSSENYEQIRNSPVETGRFLSRSEAQGAKKVAVIGQTVQEELFGDTDPIGEKILLDEGRYIVVGILESKGASFGQDMDDTILIPLAAAMNQFGMERLNYIYVESPSSEDADRTVAEVKKIIKDENIAEEDFSVFQSTEMLSTITSILSVLTLALAGIAAISLVVGGIGIMNIMLVSVAERTREIGLRKAVGAQRYDILWQFLIEAVFLSAVGGTIGIILGSLASLILGYFLKTSITAWSVILAFGVSAAVGIVFGIAPAAKAAKLDPITALRYE
ncbi:MAG: ABC transporter permease [Patescibacteria group bacterium]